MKIDSSIISFFGFKELDTYLSKFSKDLKTKDYARIGILGSKDNRSGKGSDEDFSNATIGLKQEFGIDRIPARSFLRFPLQHEAKSIIKSFDKQAEKYEKSLIGGKFINQLLKELGILGENAVQKAFETGGFGQWKPNSPVTITMKGSDKPLIDSAQLRKSITSEVVDGK